MNENKNTVADEEFINLYDLFFLFRQKLLFIIIAAVIGAVLAGAVTYFAITPKYQATSKLYIVSASSDSVVNLSDLQIGTNLTADYKELVLSRPLLESTIRNLGLDMTPNALKRMISVTNASGTRILSITATTTNPELSTSIANEMARLAVSWLPEMMASREPNIIEDAVVPTSRYSPSYTRNIFIGALICAFLYMGFEVVRYLMNDTITSAEDMEKYFGAMPMTVIPEESGIQDESDEED